MAPPEKKKIHTADEGFAFLHAFDTGNPSSPEERFRVIALFRPAPFTDAQVWTITDRGNGRFTFHVEIGGNELYLTGEANGFDHVFAAPKIACFDRQTWRRDQGGAKTLALGQTQRFLQADRVINIITDNPAVNPNALFGLDVELGRRAAFGWEEIS
jgi:hypothetical protein